MRRTRGPLAVITLDEIRLQKFFGRCLLKLEMRDWESRDKTRKDIRVKTGKDTTELYSYDE